MGGHSYYKNSLKIRWEGWKHLAETHGSLLANRGYAGAAALGMRSRGVALGVEHVPQPELPHTLPPCFASCCMSKPVGLAGLEVQTAAGLVGRISLHFRSILIKILTRGSVFFNDFAAESVVFV